MRSAAGLRPSCGGICAHAGGELIGGDAGVNRKPAEQIGGQ